MIRALAVLLAMLSLAGCETLGYYRQGIAGQLDFYGARKPIGKVLAEPGLDADTRRRLAMVPEVTAFARDQLGLPVRGQYRDYVQLDRPFVLWSLFAAPALSLQPYRWCYLLHTVCVEYRGYFREEDARAYAARLAARGYDVHIGGVAAFSSLGLLDDPVTSVLTSYPDDLLANVLFHELAHSVLYVKDDTVFNESFASAVADEGLSRWLAARGGGSDSRVLADFRAGQALLTDVALAVRADLAALYEGPLDAAGKLARKREILAGARARYEARCMAAPAPASGPRCPYGAWFAVGADGSGLNNARLNAVATYEKFVPAFARLLQAHDGDLAAFYRTVGELGDLPRAQRDKVLGAMLPAP